MNFNINNRVRVKLTPEGRAFHAADHAMFNMRTGKNLPYNPPREDEQGWSTWQLWNLMHTFGTEVCLGGVPMFGADIVLLTDRTV